MEKTKPTKRKRNDDIHDSQESEPVPKNPRKKTQSKSASTAKPKPAGNSRNSSKKLYTDTVKAIETQVKALDKKVKAMSPNSTAITTDSYAKAATKHLAAVPKIGDTEDEVPYAFNLLMAIADVSHTDLDTTPKMCGYGGSEGPFKELDEALLALIQRREQPSTKQEKLPKVPHRWTQEDAEVGEFKTGRPNKQQRGQMDRQKLEWEKARREAWRSRRETAEDWLAVALEDLKGERDYLKEYGVENYFPRSIAALEAP